MSHEVNERSFGVIPICIRDGEAFIFIVQQASGEWHFPKGHAEGNETAQETASRELGEETALRVERWLRQKPFIERYSFYRGEKSVYKEVQYFPAIVSGIPHFPPDEILAGKWVKVSEVPLSFTLAELKKLAEEVLDWIHSEIRF